MALFNAETGERFNIPFTEKVGDYFWMPDGLQFGFLPVDQNQVILFSIKDEIATKVTLSDEVLKFFYHNSDAEPIQVSNSNITDPNFLIIPSWNWNSLSPDRKYFIYQKQYDGTYTSIFDISKNQIVNISDPNDGYFDMISEWSPNSQFLAIAEADREPGGSIHVYSFETLPTIRLRVYDVKSQQLVASYKNVTFPKWSPDGTKFLFQELRELDHWSWYGESPPCIFDTVSGNTKCYNETLMYSKMDFSSVQWSPDQSMIGYIYSIGGQGGFCFITLSSGRIQCILENLEEENTTIKYTWSSDSAYISFEYDTSCPYCDESFNPKLAIANVKTGEYFAISQNLSLIHLGLWRPVPIP